jgi:hypothetical protein
MAFLISAGTYGEARQGFVVPNGREPALSEVEVRLSLREHPVCGVAAGADAIGDADPAIRVPREGKAWQVLA